MFSTYQKKKKLCFLNLHCILLCREVEDFARRLNSDWPERMQEILSLGQERKFMPISINGNAMGRYTSTFFLNLLNALSLALAVS
jgi:hypothetical protein